jgi:hypothetical protein
MWVAGSTWQSCEYNWFLNFDPQDPGLPLDTKWYPGTGLPQNPVTGDKAIFGDLGNDWIVAGMGRVRVYGGWGNDVIDLRASMNVDGGLNDTPVLNPNGTPGTPAWEALAFGGGGQDILFAGTAGDRMIDWVGNHNSYFVPFGPFGMPTVSRTLQPQLPNFLYALSQSDGADQTLGPRYSGDPARNGEPFGELGLVLQHDAAWHSQVGPPFNEMPENLGGTAIDIRKTANIRPIQSPGTDPPGNFLLPLLSLPLSADSSGATAVPIVVTGAPGATVTFDITDGVKHVTGSGNVGAAGTFGATVDVSGLADGTLTATATLTGGGAPTATVTNYMGKASTVPAAPALSAPVYANLVNASSLQLTITGTPNTLVDFWVTDGYDINGSEDVMPISGSIVEYVDVSWLKEGTLTASASLTNAVGNSAVVSATVIKDTVAPYLAVAGVPANYLTASNVNSAYLYVNAEVGTKVTYTLSDGVHLYTGSKQMNASGQWNVPLKFSGLNDGPIYLNVTATDSEGNPNTFAPNLVKETVAPGGSFSIGGTVINSVAATNNPTLALSLAFTAPSGITAVAFSTNGGSTYGAAQAYSATASLPLSGADGLYTITIRATTNAGNVGTYTKQVRLDRSGPAVSNSITAPANVGSYDAGQAITLTYSATDIDNVASVSAVLDGTTPMASGATVNTETLTPGTHAVVITSNDGLGNSSSVTITIQVHATVAGLTTAVNDGARAGKITSSVTSSQLLSYLSSAQAALNANNHASAKTYLASFVSLAQAQSGLTINAGYAALLAGWANDLIARL